MPQTILVRWSDGREQTMTIEEKVYADISCGQFEGGWIVYDIQDEGPFEEKNYFVSETGVVYEHGTDKQIGVAPEIVKRAEEIERKLDKAYE